MLKRLIWGALLLVVTSMSACQSDAPDPQATIDALRGTIDAHATLHVELTREAVSTQAVKIAPSTPTPSPTRFATVVLPTPKPALTQQRPPTATPSPSPRPTATATVTPTPIPEAAVGQILTNLRSGPAVGFAILTEVDAGTPLEVLGRSADEEWFKVRTPGGQIGWMYYLPIQINIPVELIPISE